MTIPSARPDPDAAPSASHIRFESGSNPGRTTVLSIAATVVEQLACPACHGSLSLAAATLACTACRRAYPLVDGIPVLIVERSETPRSV